LLEAQRIDIAAAPQQLTRTFLNQRAFKMSSKLIPSNPSEVMVIRRVTEEITTLSTPFSRFGHIKVGGRATLVRLRDGSVAVFSPVALTPEVKETVASMGELKYITAPDMEVCFAHVTFPAS
jgi:hypothetical protein